MDGTLIHLPAKLVTPDGCDYHGGNPEVSNARTTRVSAATALRADALADGPGGRVVWADETTEFGGTAGARGGAAGGDGGLVEGSSAALLTYAGLADAAAPRGRAGSVLLDRKDLVIDTAANFAVRFQLVDPTPGAGDRFGDSVVALSTGRVVVTDPFDDLAASNAGAVYLFDGATGALVSTLAGSSANDQVGSGGVVALSNGNYVVVSTVWNNGAATSAGAVTWCSGTTGFSQSLVVQGTAGDDTIVVTPAAPRRAAIPSRSTAAPR